MIEFTIFGTVGLRDTEGRNVEGLLRQPKRLALLLYLASPRPGHWHRRDLILAAFWPDSEESKARMALRNSLYVLRQELGPGVVQGRGDSEVAIDPAQLTCDAAELEADLAAGRLREALARYRGEALPGFNVPDAEGFERWLDDQRRHWRDGVLGAAAALRDEARRGGDHAAAIGWQRRALELAPHSEQEARALIELLAASGDIGGALATYDVLRSRLAKDFGVSPSETTRALVDQLRARLPAEPVAARGAGANAPTAELMPQPSAPSPQAIDTTVPARTNRRWWTLAAVGTALLGLTTRALTSVKHPGSVPPAHPTVLIRPIKDGTGDTTLAYLSEGIAQDLVRRLAATGVVLSRFSRGEDGGVEGAQGGARVVDGDLHLVSDSLAIGLTITDPATLAATTLPVVRVPRNGLEDGARQLTALVVGTLHRAAIPQLPRLPAGRVDPEAFRLTLLGWQQLLGQGRDQEAALAMARESFRRAIDHDPSYARAWSGLSSTWAAATVTGRVPVDNGIAAGEAAARHAIGLDSLEGTAWANLGVFTMLRQHSLAAAESLFQRAIAAEPGNAELYMIQASARGWAWQWDETREPMRIARALDPLSTYYAGHEATLALCAGDAARALTLFREELALDPKLHDGQLGVARALARLGRWDDAIAAIAPLVIPSGESGARTVIASVHGEAGYWSLRHREGERLLAARMAKARSGTSWLSPYLIAVAEVGAGHLDRGLTMLEAEARAGNWMLAKLPCNPDVDEVRSTPRFAKLLDSVRRFATTRESVGGARVTGTAILRLPQRDAFFGAPPPQ